MDYFLCSLVFMICLSSNVDSQLPPKSIGEWHPDRALMYPNPWVNSSACKTKEVSGLCDYNAILTVEQRDYFSAQPEIKKNNNPDECLCSQTCFGRKRIMVTVAVMKKIGPLISDYKVAAQGFALHFRENWNLQECTVILVASHGDNMSYIDPGTHVNTRTDCSVNVTTAIDQLIYDTYFKNGLFVEGINATLHEYRECNTIIDTEKEPDSSNSTTVIIIIVVIVVFLGIAIVAILVVIVKRRRNSRAHQPQGRNEKRPLSSGESAAV